MAQEYNLKVSPESANIRLDIFISNFSKENNLGFSRTFIQALILGKAVTVNNLCVNKSNHKVKSGDEVKIQVKAKEPVDIKSENIPLKIIYEDADIAIIDKQIGLVVHPAPGNYEHTLVNALAYHIDKLSDVNKDRPGVVHRLDKDTSGLIVVAKNNAAHLHLAEQFSKHSIKRKYVALVSGRVEFDEDVIEMPIGRDPRERKNMAVGFGKNTRYAKTFYRTLKRTQEFSLLELEPFTGRTHQLRVHLAFLGHPILGDVKYGKKNTFSRLALHAKSIGFIHPRTGKFVEFSSEIPREFIEFLEKNNSSTQNKS